MPDDGDLLGSIASPEHRRILKLMRSPAYRDPKNKQNAAVSSTVRAYFERVYGTDAPALNGVAQSPLPASRTPDPTRRKGVA